MVRTLITWVMTFALLAAPAGFSPAIAKDKIKYEKTEVEKAKGKCVGAVLGGALLGALVGRATGRDNTLVGAGLGAAAGGAACAVIMANARHKDRIIVAQIAAAQYRDSPYITTFHDDADNSTTTFRGVGGPDQQIDAARLRPVRYVNTAGEQIGSPALEAGDRDCRPISSSLSNGDGAVAQLPTQYVCRTPDGDYEPYAVKKA